jgi:ubiquitin-like-conjugating enzyme ATG10
LRNEPFAEDSQFHPITDLPSFFVHPCNTHEALIAARDTMAVGMTEEEYLLLWLGIVGSAVGLHVPSKLVAS